MHPTGDLLHVNMKLTYSIIHSAGSSGGDGFNYAQLKLLGVELPPKKGWLSNLIGKEVPDDIWIKVMALKGVRRKAERKALLNSDFCLPGF